jgi:hypothetical protein
MIKELKINDVLVAKYEAIGDTVFLHPIVSFMPDHKDQTTSETMLVYCIRIVEKKLFTTVGFLNVDASDSDLS